MKPSGIVVAVLALAWLALRWRQGKLTRGNAAIWVLLAVAGAIYGTGVIHLPSAEHVIRRLGTTLGAWTYLLVGVLAFLETGAGVGLIAPGEATILLGGFVAGQGKISLPALLAIVWGAAVAGDLTSFLLGRRLGREFLHRHGSRVKLTPERLEKVEEFFDRRGGMAILLGRFVGLVRAVAPFIAGASRMPLARFLPYDIIGAGVWGCGLVLLGFAFWRSFDRLLAVAKQGALGLGLAIAFIAGVVTAARWLSDDEHRRELRERLERHPVGRRVALPVARLAIRLTPGRTGLEVVTLSSVVLVAGFAFAALWASLRAGGPPLPADTDAARLTRHLHTGTLDSVAKVITFCGQYPVLELAGVATVGALLWRRRTAEALAVLAGLAATIGLTQLVKAAADRPRPTGALVATDGASFPSGHASASVLWLVIGILLARPGPGIAAKVGLVVAGFAATVLVGLSRIYLRAHWLSDVLAGWGLGLACFGICGLVAVVVTARRNNGASPA